MATRVGTRDIGFAIRDFIEGRDFDTYSDDPDHEGELIESEERRVLFVDVGEAHNLVIHIDNGQKFRVCIFLI